MNTDAEKLRAWNTHKDRFTTTDGPTWRALRSDEMYGTHFSVSAHLRKPTDEEVEQARVKNPEADEATIEITHRRTSAVNPYVRHFVTQEAINVMGDVFKRL